MAHDFVKDQFHLDAEGGRLGLQIILTLLGGTLLIASAVAYGIYENNDTAQLFAAAATILLAGPLIWTAAMEILHGHQHMNELVALAVLAAFATGQYIEAGAIAFFMIISVLIENRTALGAQKSIESLVRITPTRAFRVVGDQEEEIDAASLSPGDVVRVRPGDNIPADGVIDRGASTVDQANITGESFPVEKEEGDEVYSGTINLTGVMEIRVTSAGEDTTLGRVKEMILQAEQTKAPFMRMIDRYASWYTPTVLMLTFMVWFFVSQTDPTEAASRAISMLVIACPCALILATPTAMVASLSAAARLGVLVKSVVNLEAARGLTSVIFDKTGTLTTGSLEVSRLAPAEGVDGADLLRSAASAEQNSRHPVARAVFGVARKARLELTEPVDFEEVAGKGVRTRIGEDWVLVGRGTWLAEEQISDGARGVIEQIGSSAETEGLSVLYVVRNGEFLGWIGLADNTRGEAAHAVDWLRNLGIKRMVMCTGDRESVAKRVAEQLNTEYQAEVLPGEKLELVDQLKGRGHSVAMVGDGVNDAPALAAGDISIAMGAAGSDVAIHSASIVINNNNLNRIPFLIDLSRRTHAVVLQNLALGGVFVIAGLALSAIGYIPAIAAAVLHVVSSLIVIFNSARLVRVGEEIEEMEAKGLDRKHGQRAAARSGSGDGAAAGGLVPA
ncbi:heavy metal translocating P-type ATPase [Mucisphaera calidilacus]|uniref:P-type Zn(2+) transporter n=1 Tax=Mucisphaera calidilacus TaxID=2527982 RepID=A0A518C0K0_9BACT|nr:cation-translocating P-type ATPase [Mucisphaera calidilacus]QDU72753.1 putative copper-transporting ATPase PacS [Mucisphaera calidilacus]